MRKGFTLIELLVVIAIIGILSTLAVVALNTARERSRDAKRISDIKQIQNALEIYDNESSGYPSTATGTPLGTPTAKALCTGGFKAVCDPGDTVFMGLVPIAPIPVESGCAPSDNDYTYNAAPNTPYTLTFCLGAQTGQLTAGIHTATPNGIE